MKEKNTGIRNWVIYKITSPSGRIYIGKTANFHRRKIHYKCASSTKNQRILFKSFQKYGFINHVIEIIDSFNSDQSYCNGKEMFWIRSHMSNHSKWPEMRGMNLTDGGEGSLGIKRSEEQKKKHSEYMKNSNIKRHNKPHSPETKAKFKEIWRKRLEGGGFIGNRKGKTVSTEVRLKMSKAREGIVYKRGHKLSEAHKLAMKLAQRKPKMSGYKMSEEGRKSFAESRIIQKGYPILQFTKEGVFIREFRAVCEAVRETSIPKTTIFNLLNRTKKPKGQFIFKYKKDIPFDRISFQRRIFKLKDIKEKIA